MMREGLRALLAAILVFQPVIASTAQAAQSAASPQKAESEIAALKGQALKIPLQSSVEVRLQSKEKVQGRLAEVTDQGLTIQVAQGDEIQVRQVAFGDVESIKKRGSKTKKVVLWTLAGVGIVFIAGAAICAKECN